MVKSIQLQLDLDSVLSEPIKFERPAIVVEKRLPYQISAYDPARQAWIASYTEAPNNEIMIERCQKQFPNYIAHCGTVFHSGISYPHDPIGVPDEA